MDNKIRFRYGRTEGRHPKNTLATVRDGEHVYFGISRCNTDMNDKFNKEDGRKYALIRAQAAGVSSNGYVFKGINN